MSAPLLGWTHQAELVRSPCSAAADATASPTLFPYSDAKAVAAIAVFIFAARLGLFHLWSNVPGALPSKAPSALMHLVLTLDFAVEYPLLLAFHPCTLACPRDPFGRAELPGLLELAAQVGVCAAVEAACQYPLSRIFADASSGKDDPAMHSTVLFLRPRAALMVAAALLGTPSCITAVTGRLHAVSMAVWILAQRQRGALGDDAKFLDDEE